MENKLLIYSFLFVFCIGIVSGATVDYTPTSTTECSFGVCTKTLYSGVQNVIEDKEWKDVSKVVSLKDKGAYRIKIIESDKKYPMSIIDYNMTSITLDLEQWSLFNEEVDLRIWKRNDTKYKDYLQLNGGAHGEDYDGDYKDYCDKVIHKKEVFNIFDLGSKVSVYDFIPGDIIEFGPNSTTITLQTADSENLEDTTVLSAYPTTYAGDNIGIAMGGYTSAIRNGMIKFNISSLNGMNILTANVSLYMQGKYYAAGEYFDVKATQIYDNYDWTESATWNTRPTDGTEVNTSAQDSILFNSDSAIGWYVWDVDEMLTDEVTTGNGQNLSIYFVSYDFNSNGPNDVIDIASKENAVTDNRPKLAVTYLEDTCTYGGSGNWEVNCADNCSIESDVDLGGNDISIIGAGTFTMNGANVTNFGDGFVAGTDANNICTVRCLNGGCLNF